MNIQISVSDIFRKGLKSAKSQMWVLAGLLIGYFILSFTLNIFAMPIQQSLTGRIIVNIVSILFSAIFNLGYFKNHFQALDDMEPQFSAYGQESRKVMTYLAALVIATLATVIGLLLFVIPGIYLAIRLQYYTAFIIEENAGAIESLKRSWQITQGHTGSLFLLFLAMLGIGIIGLLLAFIGVFFAIPVIYQMYCESFRRLNTPLQFLDKA